MIGFQGPLDCRQKSSELWELLADLSFQSANWPLIVVPAGFVTDFASTPKAVWTFMPKSGGYDPAAVVHDYLYVEGGHLPGILMTKLDADKVFAEGLKILGVGNPKRWMMYMAVRIGGRGNFSER